MRHCGGGVGHKGMHFANRCLLAEEHAFVDLDSEDGGKDESGKGGEGEEDEGDVQATGEDGQGGDDGGEDSGCETDKGGHKDEDEEELRDDEDAIVNSAGFGSL